VAERDARPVVWRQPCTSRSVEPHGQRPTSVTRTDRSRPARLILVSLPRAAPTTCNRTGSRPTAAVTIQASGESSPRSSHVAGAAQRDSAASSSAAARAAQLRRPRTNLWFARRAAARASADPVRRRAGPARPRPGAGRDRRRE
jgi:hypothetical protein